MSRGGETSPSVRGSPLFFASCSVALETRMGAAPPPRKGGDTERFDVAVGGGVAARYDSMRRCVEVGECKVCPGPEVEEEDVGDAFPRKGRWLWAPPPMAGRPRREVEVTMGSATGSAMGSAMGCSSRDSDAPPTLKVSVTQGVTEGVTEGVTGGAVLVPVAAAD